ncbi:hypothetical protein B0F90DRAFT_1811029 [Multifurca ochricompacta]|uniref:D-isomer specific 2-hydroxyacid dehydrogenase catalytic domain-containing protein n=1 Tax=Multifurca ochricompacta TaxID=376703 RepID=A0AAD4M2B9_9AGAM|nr:hypothetical protein B0F90DRAFT_1811029 [Multifurca ochricompacta]
MKVSNPIKPVKAEPRLLSTVENELGLRKCVESRFHDSNNSDFQKHTVNITTPFHPGAKNLKFCVTAGVGSDHIDLNAAMTGSNVVSITEQVVMSMLLLMCNVVPVHEMATRGDWQCRIGYRVLQRLVPFNYKELLYYDYNPLPADPKRQSTLGEFVSQCDVRVRSAGRVQAGRMARQTARGAICVAEDVAAVVRSGQLRGYAGDVWNVQQAPKDHPGERWKDRSGR